VQKVIDEVQLFLLRSKNS